MTCLASLSFTALRRANVRRQAEWPGNDRIDLAFRTLETAGETGELAEAIAAHLRTSLLALAAVGSLGRVSEQMKKTLRAERGIKGSTADATDIAREMADCTIALDLLAEDLGIDLGDAVAAKFNETSEKHGLMTRIVNRPAGLAKSASSGASPEIRTISPAHISQAITQCQKAPKRLLRSWLRFLPPVLQWKGRNDTL